MSRSIRFEVTSTDIEVKTGTNGRGPWTIREQEAHMFKGDDKYPEKVVVTLDDQQAPYAPGMYEMDDKSIYVGRFKQPQLRLRLKPIAAPVRAQQAG